MNLYDEFLNDWSEKWFQYVKDNSDKDWDYKWLSQNPNITWKIVESNLDKPWNYKNLSYNTMDKVRKEYIRKRFQEWFKKSDLKKELMENVWHPRNWEKFKYLDPETFGDLIEE